MDFRKGDKVWSTSHGNGVVSQICKGCYTYPVEVDFENEAVEEFTTEGFYCDEDPQQSLFHGHDLQITGEVIPPRFIQKYINFYHKDCIYYGPYPDKRMAEECRGEGAETLTITVPEE
jgi:hypothetical protein